MVNKLKTISNLFDGKEIRSVWDAEKEEYYFSVVDIISALTDGKWDGSFFHGKWDGSLFHTHYTWSVVPC